jgi:hypothetical protein
MRQGHRGALRRAALPLQRLPARELGGAPVRRRIGRTTVQSPLRWRADASWKLDFSNLDRLTPGEIAERRQQFDEVKAVARSKREEA